MTDKKHNEEQEVDCTPESEELEMTDEEFGLEDAAVATPEDITADGPTELEILQDELAKAKDKHLRLAAEFDNYRKRTLREKTELIQTAGEVLLRDILPVVDDFDRGLEMIDHAEDMESIKIGMTLIYHKLKDFLTNNGVKEILAMDLPFDADWHEAVTNIPVPSEDMKGKIVDVIQKGYVLHDKVMRYPKVVVGE